MTNAILYKLAQGDRRTTGRVKEVVADVIERPDLFPLLFEAMLVEEPATRMRAADAVVKIASEKPELLQPYKSRIIHEVSSIPQQEVQWHVAQMFSLLELTPHEITIVKNILFSYLNSSKSSIVKTFVLQALADLTTQAPALKPRIKTIIDISTRVGTPAMKARAKQLMKDLE